MGCSGSKEDTYSRFPALTDWQIEQLRLPAPPVNGFDSFLRLAWCRDVKEEGEKAAAAQKAHDKAARRAKKRGEDEPEPPQEIPKTYYVCLVTDYGPYDDNETVNLQKAENAYEHLPKWQDPDYMEDCLRHERFYQNDAWILEHVPTAIRKPSDYLYDEQFTAAFGHWNGGVKPPAAVLHAHHERVATAVYRELHGYAVRGGRDAKGRDRSTTIRKLENLLRSCAYDVALLTACQGTVEAEYKVRLEQEAKLEKKRQAEAAAKAKADEAKAKADAAKAVQAQKKETKKAAKQAKKKKAQEPVIMIVHPEDNDKVEMNKEQKEGDTKAGEGGGETKNATDAAAAASDSAHKVQTKAT